MTPLGRSSFSLIAAAAYFSRPWSCTLVLQSIPKDGSPHSMFDYHGAGVLLAWATTLVLGPLAWMLVRRGTERGARLDGIDARATVGIILVMLLLGTPLYSQFAYLVGLPLSLSWPVLVSSALWFAIATYLCIAAVSPENELA